MMKLGWQLIANPDKLWVQIMRAKYGCGLHTVPEVRVRSNSSITWRAIAHVWEDVKGGITWGIRNGQNTRFWKDAWVPNMGCLIDHVNSQGPDFELDFPVAHYVKNGDWDWQRLGYWHVQGPNRYQTFLWKLSHGKLLTNAERVHRAMANDGRCPRCQDCSKQVMHILHDCDVVRGLWEAVVKEEHLNRFFSLGLLAWLDWNVSNPNVVLHNGG